MKKITLEYAQKLIESFPDEEMFVDAHFQQGLSGYNEYWDNSMDLAWHHQACVKFLNDSKSRSGTEANE